MNERHHSVIYNIASISFLGIAAKLMGLFREGILASYFGTSAEMDIFGLIGGYVTTMMSVLAISLAQSYSPLFIRNLQKQGERTASQGFSHLLNQYVLFTIVGYFFVFLLSPALSNYICGKSESYDFNTVLLYTRLMFCTIITGGTTRLFVSALNGLRKYGWMQITQILYSVLTIILTWMFGKSLGIKIVVVAFFVNSIIQVLILWIVYFHGERKYEFEIGLQDKDTIYAWKSFIPVFLGTETYMLGLTIDRTIGVSLGVVGVVAALQYAGMLYGLINMVVSTPINTVFCTEMYRNYYKTENQSVLYNDLVKITNHVAVILIPLSFFLFATTTDFVTVVLKRGAFDEHSVAITASAYGMYVLASPIMSIRGLYTGVHIAQKDRRTPMWGGIIFLVLNLLFAYLLSRPLGVMGITMGGFIANIVSLGYQSWSLKHRHNFESRLFTPTFIKIIIAAIFASVSVYVLGSVLSGISVYVRFVLLGFLFGGVYALILYLTKCKELSVVINGLLKNKSKK